MARKTFISYKYSEAQDLRDRILDALGDDATYYKGETAESPDLTDNKVETIKERLKDMMRGTSVTIVIVSPNMKQSKWIDWEIEYSLKEIEGEGRVSRTNGIVGVIMKSGGSYDWLVTTRNMEDGCTVLCYFPNRIYDIINNNICNLKGDNKYVCERCKSCSVLEGSYISLIDEENFLRDPGKYVENAYEKSQQIENFDISKQR